MATHIEQAHRHILQVERKHFTTRMSAWHWQERYDNGGDPERACRQQVLQVQKEIPFKEWLQHKKASQSPLQVDSSYEKEDEEEKRRECEKRFREWVGNKQRQLKKEKEKARAAKMEDGGPRTAKRNDQPYSKPISLHVNPRIKRPRGDATTSNSESKKRGDGKCKKPAPREQSLAAYFEWERRKRSEDPIKRKHRLLNQQLEEHAQRLLHLTIWKKKDVVCAYSTNRRTSERAGVSANKLRAA